MQLQYSRPDGSFVAIVNGYPYHITPDDALFTAASALAAELGEPLPLEPPPPALDAPLSDISDRQFAQGLAELGLISEAEAEEWVASGALPQAIMAIVDQLPEADRFPARMLLRGATRFEFSHPLAEAFAQLASPPWSTEARAAFWRHCATL